MPKLRAPKGYTGNGQEVMLNPWMAVTTPGGRLPIEQLLKMADFETHGAVHAPAGTDPMSYWAEMKKAGGYIEQLAESIKANGLLKPLSVFAQEGEPQQLGDGHHRLLAALKLGLKELPVRFNNMDFLD